MRNYEVKRVTEVKNGRNWEQTYVTYDELEIYKSLSRDLTAKKICQASYIKSIKRVNMYDGSAKIIVTYDNDCRNIYNVEN